MHDYAYPLIGVSKHGTLNRIANGLQFAKVFSTKLPTVIIRPIFYHQNFYFMLCLKVPKGFLCSHQVNKVSDNDNNNN